MRIYNAEYRNVHTREDNPIQGNLEKTRERTFSDGKHCNFVLFHIDLYIQHGG